MTEQELIARLLDEETDLADCAVDRIEQTEAKLTKAMAALRNILSGDDLYPWRIAREALAELEGK